MGKEKNDIKEIKPFKFTGENCDYEISGTNDPYTIVLYRKDGKALGDSDIIPRGFLEMGISIAVMERQKEGYAFFNYATNNKLSDDSKQLIMIFQIEKKTEPIGTKVRRLARSTLIKR